MKNKVITINFKKDKGFFFIKIYNKHKFVQHLIDNNISYTFFYISLFLYKLGINIFQ